MTRLGLLRDSLFRLATIAYAVNRWGLKPRLASAFLHGQFNDLLLIPAALPVVLWLHSLMGWRDADLPPTGSEITLHLVAWSVICEGVGPRWFHWGVADAWDLVAYAVGGLAAGLWWNRARWRTAWAGRRVV
jgi:hypothetical protein